MTTQQTPSWEAVIACHDPTQPTRYYRSYTLHYPASSSEHINTTLHHTLQAWSTGTGLTLSTQHPLLAISDEHTTTITASSRDFDQLLDFDTDFRTTAQALPNTNVTPSTLELLAALQDAEPNNGSHTPRSTLEIITQLQANAFDLGI